MIQYLYLLNFKNYSMQILTLYLVGALLGIYIFKPKKHNQLWKQLFIIPFILTVVLYYYYQSENTNEYGLISYKNTFYDLAVCIVPFIISSFILYFYFNERLENNGKLKFPRLLVLVSLITLGISLFGYFKKDNKLEAVEIIDDETEKKEIETLAVVAVEDTTKVYSEYYGNHLKTGDTPFNICYGQGEFAGKVGLQINNRNFKDVVVLLVNSKTKKTIRNVYIENFGDVKINAIPTGRYYLKLYCGEGWNPNLATVCGKTGGFEEETKYFILNASDDIIESNGMLLSSIELHTDDSDEIKYKEISKEDFFR